MKNSPNLLPGIGDSERAIEIIIKVGLLGLLVTYCFMILQPFLMIIIWALVISVALFPLYAFLERKFRGRKKLAAVVVTLILLAAIILPMVLLGESLAGGIGYLIDLASKEGFSIPPPPAEISGWPVIGSSLHNFWQQASLNLEELIVRYSPELKEVFLWVVSSLANVGTGFLLFILSIVVAGFFLAFAETGGKTMTTVIERLAGDKGEEYLQITRQTIRKVAIGIVGVPMLQSVLAGMGFLMAGVPAAGLWALAAFILGIVQIGLGPVVISVLIYVFVKETTLTFILLTAWSVPIFLLDNILKPIIFGRNAPVPMLVVFIGSIGGFLASGIIGLFVGAIVLTLGYRFFRIWVTDGTQTTTNV